ncbi:hypothetical protein CAPTEDRAFT_204546 [Capitella teleta]|uniref:Uncharacterized protein n=1 Tax=Capitella teleta TaxID=283909 RepID=R7VGK3_CAPTE|nr:hypothetical protein CAPTEDRAFT_204546 [Capitella teleta]|eukprot:ELU17983.1 hypothetical protein CAPTEDRAFT_204546 [Capitella teleta]
MEESLQEFASRVQQLARDAHPSLVTEAVEPMAVDAFLRGCKEKLAAYSALNREPATVELAVNLVEGAVTNQQAVFGSTVPVSKLRQVLRFENPTQTQPDDYQVRAVHASSVEGLEAATERRFRQCEGALVEVKAGLSSLGEQMKEVMSLGFFQARVVNVLTRSDRPDHGQTPQSALNVSIVMNQAIMPGIVIKHGGHVHKLSGRETDTSRSGGATYDSTKPHWRLEAGRSPCNKAQQLSSFESEQEHGKRRCTPPVYFKDYDTDGSGSLPRELKVDMQVPSAHSAKKVKSKRDTHVPVIVHMQLMVDEVW